MLVSTVTKSMQVRLWRQGPVFKVSPACPKVLRILQTVYHRADLDREHGYRVQRQVYPMFDEHDDCGTKVMGFPAGLEPIVRKLLLDAGHHILTIDEFERLDGGRAEWPLAPSGGRLADRPLLDAVYAHERLLVRYRLGHVHPAKLISQIAHAWPMKKIHVAVTRQRDVAALGGQLQTDLPDTGVITCKHPLAKTGQVTVGTYQSLPGAYQAQGGTELERIDLIIMLDAQEALGTAGIACLRKCYRARLVGLLPLGTDFSTGEQDELAAIYGFQQVVIPRYGHRQRQVEVRFIPIYGGPTLGADIDLVTQKRAGLWRHPVRNRQIARLAHRDLGQADGRRSPSRIILVENVEHALALSRLLPTWSIVAGDAVHAAGLSQIDQSMLNDNWVQHGMTDRAIVTAQGMYKIKLSEVDIVIRADGGTGLPALNLNDLIEPNQQTPRLLQLIDFIDHHHPDLHQRSRQRQQAYREQGWYEAGVDPVEERMQQFLRQLKLKMRGASDPKVATLSVQEQMQQFMERRQVKSKMRQVVGGRK